MSWQARDEGRSRGKLGGPLSSGDSSQLVGGSELAGEGSGEVPLLIQNRGSQFWYFETFILNERPVNCSVEDKSLIG